MGRFLNTEVFNWHEEGIPYLSFAMLDELGYGNLYTTRYNDIRVALMKDDDPEEAIPVLKENLSRLAISLGADPAKLRTTRQLHTANVVVMDKDDLGLERSFDNLDPIDGMVTNVPGAGLIVFGADCPSIYIVDPIHHAIGLVHAGWRGTLGKIPKNAIELMQQSYGSDPAEMFAAIGPSICADCYEMGDEVFDVFADSWGEDDAVRLMQRRSSGKYHLDLWLANRLTLERCGIPSTNIAVTDLCTCCHSDHFYSYRAHRMENEQCAILINK